MKHRICPKCKSIPIYYTELWKNSTIEFTVLESQIEEEGICSPGQPYGVEAQCDCGHRWKLKKITQITDLKGI